MLGSVKWYPNNAMGQRKTQWTLRERPWCCTTIDPLRSTMMLVPQPKAVHEGWSTAAQPLRGGVQSTALHAVHHVTHLYVHAREKTRISYFDFSNFVNPLRGGVKLNFTTWRGGPSRSNSLCKNRKKWEKTRRKCGFLSFFVKNGSIFYLNFQVNLVKK